MLTPVGNNVTDTWNNIQNGVSGIGLIEHFDTSDFSSYPMPDKYKFKATKYVSITVAEGDDEGIEEAIKILESMRSKPSDPVEAAQEDDDSDDTFADDFKEDNL